MDAMLLEFVKINSTIEKYLNNLESSDDEELVPRKNKVHNNNIKPPKSTPKKDTFAKEPNGIYNTVATSVVGAPEYAKYFISNGKKPNKVFVIPNSDTMSATGRMKLAQKLWAPANEVDIVRGVHYTLLSGVNFAYAYYVTILDLVQPKTSTFSARALI